LGILEGENTGFLLFGKVKSLNVAWISIALAIFKGKIENPCPFLQVKIAEKMINRFTSQFSNLKNRLLFLMNYNVPFY